MSGPILGARETVVHEIKRGPFFMELIYRYVILLHFVIIVTKMEEHERLGKILG